MGEFLRNTRCEKCGSSDGRSIYADNGGSYCWVCQDFEASKDSPKKPKVKFSKEKNLEEKDESKMKPMINKEDWLELKALAVTRPVEYRGIRDEIYKKFGVLHMEDDDGNLTEQIYPCTYEGNLSGAKKRILPKTFESEGRVGSDCELFMQVRFPRGAKYLIITEGEIDGLSAYQMMYDYAQSKGSGYETAVVSPTVGANSLKQIKNNYKFFDQFENIILSYDNDDAGRTAAEKIIPFLPKGRVKIMKMRYKDANKYLTEGKQREFINDFYAAERHVPVGVLPSGQLYDRMMNQAKVKKVPFPPFMGKLNEKVPGGMPLGHIVNVAADTGLGKTTLVNEMVYYWIFNSPHKVGVVSMELDAGQYAEVITSRHLRKKLALIPSEEEKLEYLSQPDVQAKIRNLMQDEDGDDRFFVLDNRDGSVEEIQDTIEELVISCGAKLIVLDPLQDILDGLSNDEQAQFMKWMKGFIKSHGVLFILINHMRKTPAGQSGGDNEQNIMGSSTIIKSASLNVLLKRDKMSEDPIVQNTTTIDLSKNRICGLTGPSGATYYDNETHTLHELDAYLNGESF